MKKKYDIQNRPELIIKGINTYEQDKEDRIEEIKEKNKKRFQSEKDKLLEDTQDAMIDEARTCLQAARVNHMSVLDPDYKDVVENTERLTKSAKLIDDMRHEAKKGNGALIGGIASALGTVGMFVTDFVFKHPIAPAVRSFFDRIRRR